METNHSPSQSTIPQPPGPSALQRIRNALRSNLTKVWPTRHQRLCPPAMAALVDGLQLDLPEVLDGPTLVVFLPDSFAPHLRALADQQPAVRVHADIGLQTQAAYLSWSAPQRYLPPTVWVALEDLRGPLGLDCSVDEPVESGFVQVVWVCGESFAFGGITCNVALRRKAAEARARCETGPDAVSVEELAKARLKAERYSERPWLFMPYELQNGPTRLCVSWAPLRRMTRRTDA